MAFSNYFKTFNLEKIIEDYPVGDEYISRYSKMSSDELRNIQNTRFMSCIERAWQIPFYQRHWGAVGLEKADVRSLDDLLKIPSYSKKDLMKSVADHPPFGDFHGVDRSDPNRPPVIFHTTSGTTGTPQPLFFGPKTREVQNLLYVRAVLMQGLRHDDVIHSLYGFGTVNAGHYVREALIRYTNAIVLTASTGSVTPSKQQVNLMNSFKSTVLIGFADYIRKLSDVAREEGFEPGVDIPIRLILSSIGGESRAAISKCWGGAEVYDTYGVGDTGIISAESPHLDGLHLFDDAHVVEIIDPDTLAPVEDGQIGNICVTSIFKDDVFPNIRFNSNDLSAIETSSPKTDWNIRRMRGFLGRSDGMIKLRGINVYPTAVGELIRMEGSSNGEFLCQVDRDGTRDEMTVLIEVNAGATDRTALGSRYQTMLKEKIGLAMQVEIVEPGSLAQLTGLESRQKAVRLLDKRVRV